MPTITFANVLEYTARANAAELSLLEQTIAMRRRQLGVTTSAGSLNAHAYRIGQIVRMSQRIRPQYLRGLLVRVVGINRTTVSVRFPVGSAYGRFSGCQRVRLPISLIAGVVDHAPNGGEDDGLAAEPETLMTALDRIIGGQR